MNNVFKTTTVAVLTSLFLTACGSKNTDNSSENANQANQIHSLKTQLEEAQTKAQQQNTDLTIQLNEVQKALAQSEEKLKNAEVQAALNTSNLAKITAQKTEIEANLNKARKEYDQAITQRDVAYTAKALAEQKFQKEAEKASTMSAEREQAKSELASKQKQYDEASLQLIAARTAKEKAESDLATATAQLAAAQQAEATAKSQLSAEKTAKENAQAELTKLQKMLDTTVTSATYWDKKWRYLGFDKGTVFQRVTIGRTSIDIDLSGYPISDNVIEKSVYDNGNKVGEIAFINQSYSSYTSFLPETTNTQRYSGADYVFLPTDANADIFNSGINTTYIGKALEHNFDSDGNNITTANFRLDVDFNTKTASGMITERTNGRDDIQLHQATISNPVSNGYFNMPYMGLSGTATTLRKNGEERTGSYEAFFAGENAEEVVGAVDGLGTETTFGGKR